MASSTTASPTTLFFHTSTTIFTFRTNTDTVPIPLYQSGTTSTIVTSGFALYVPFSTNISVSINATALVDALGTLHPTPRRSLPIFGLNSALAATATPLGQSVVPVSSQDTLYIPVTGSLPVKVHLNSLTLALSSAHATVSSIAASSTSSSSTAGSASSPTRASGASSTSSTRTAQSKETTPTGVSKGISTGALAGGVVGAFIVGLLCAFIAFWCIRRRSSRRPSTQARSDGSSQGTLLARDTSSQEKPHPAVVASDLTGWRKHLPQEKDDRTITRAFQLLFEHVQLHVEGFYETEPGPVSPESIETLRNLSSDDFPRLLTQTKDVIPLLEGILVRWLVHRISGLSSAEESLLPLELAKIPEKNKWHMENDVEGNGLIAENKRGYPQAFSQWRQLTGFLGRDPGTGEVFKRDLSAEIDKAVGVLNEAFAPWEAPGKSNENRRESLRRILLQASDAGILLFTQPSTFMFDWSTQDLGRDQTVAITPALVKRLDESAKPLGQAQVLVPSRPMRIEIS